MISISRQGRNHPIRSKLYCVIMLAALLICSAVGPLGATERIATLNELIVLGLTTNLGLRIDQLQVEADVQAVIIEDAAFDSELYSLAGYSNRTTPYVTQMDSGRLTAQEVSAEIGIRQRFTTGLSGSLSLRSTRTSDVDQFSSLDPSYQNTLMLELDQPLLRRRGSDINTTALQRSRYQLQQAELTYLLQAQTLALQLESAVRSLAGQEQTVDLRKQALELADQLLRANQARFDEGLVPITEVQEAQAARAARQLRYAEARQQQDLQLAQLRRHLNRQLPADFAAESLIFNRQSDLPYSTADHDIATSLAVARHNRLDLEISRLAVKSSQVQQGYLENQLQPQLDLQLQAGISGLSGRDSSNPNHAYRGGVTDSFGSMAQADGHHWGAGLEFSIPIGNREARSRLFQSQAVTRQQQYRLADLDVQLEFEVEEQVINLEHSARQLTIADEFERLATIALEQEQRRVEAGLSDTFRLLSFQDNMIDARIDRLQAATRYQLALAQLAYVRGEILERYNINLPGQTEGLNQ